MNPAGLPFDGPQTSSFGPRQPVRVNNLAAAMHSNSISFALGGKTYEFTGALLTEPSVMVSLDPVTKQIKRTTLDSLIWSSYGVSSPWAQIVLNADGSFGGTFWVDGRIYLLRGKGSDGLIVEQRGKAREGEPMSGAALAQQAPSPSSSAPTASRSKQPGPPWGPPQPVQTDMEAALNAGVVTFSLDGTVYRITGAFRPVERDGSQAWVSDRNQDGQMTFARMSDGRIVGTIHIRTGTYSFFGRGTKGVLREIPPVVDDIEEHERLHRKLNAPVASSAPR